MSFLYFGSNGVYSVDLTATGQKNIANAWTTATTTSYGTLGGFSAGAATIGGVQYFQAPQSLVDAEDKMVKTVKAAKRAAKGILSKLREEIDGWHGNILERCPA